MTGDLGFKSEILDFLFSELCLDSPCYIQRVKEESPDFIVYLNNKRIGIEHTHLYHEFRAGESSKKIEKFLNSIVERLNRDQDFTQFDIWIRFDYDYFENKKRRIEKVKTLLIHELMKCFDKDGLLKNKIEIKGISGLYENKKSSNLNWIAYKGGSVTKIDLENLLRCVNEKNKLLLEKYENSDENWLAIFVNQFDFSQQADVEVEVKLNTDFDKVYIISNFGSVIQLK